MTESQAPTRVKCPLVYGKLAPHYFEEAGRCLEHRCFIAAIAMSWAAVDHAVGQELLGGRKCDRHTLRPRRPVDPFPNNKVPAKLQELWKLFPSLAPWEKRLLNLYHGYRNTFLHAILTNIVENQPVVKDGVATSTARIKVRAEVPTEKLKSLAALSDSEFFRPPNLLDREYRILELSEPAAHEAYAMATKFLRDLNRAIDVTDVRSFP